MRLWYKATNFQEGLTVTIWFIKPDLTQSPTQTMIEWGEGLYYIDAPINNDGPYVGKVFENGTPVLAYVFRQGVCPGIVRKI